MSFGIWRRRFLKLVRILAAPTPRKHYYPNKQFQFHTISLRTESFHRRSCWFSVAPNAEQNDDIETISVFVVVSLLQKKKEIFFRKSFLSRHSVWITNCCPHIFFVEFFNSLDVFNHIKKMNSWKEAKRFQVCLLFPSICQ